MNITGANTINSDSTTQQVYNADDTSLTITNSSTLSRTGQAPVNINEKDDGTLTINSGSSITATSHNTVQGDNQDGLTVTNSGTISSGGSKAINLLNAQNSSITNNSGGIINFSSTLIFGITRGLDPVAMRIKSEKIVGIKFTQFIQTLYLIYNQIIKVELSW